MRTRRLALGLALITAMTACGGDTETEDDAALTTGDGAALQEGVLTLQPGQMVDPNTASRDTLLAIPNLGATRVDAIIAARPHADMLAVDRVIADMPEAARDSVYTWLWMPIDLNTATDEQILLIPGIGDRMLHEFKEYRPYTNIEQFRREMGKYVDEAEVARMERYVMITATDR